MKNKPYKNLNAFQGWALVFLLMHVPIALYNFLGGLTLIGTFIGYKVSLWFVILSAILAFLLPAAIILFLRRKPYFRWIYVSYTLLLAINFLKDQGITPMSIGLSLILTTPWIIYLFSSKRIKAILANEISPPDQVPEE